MPCRIETTRRFPIMAAHLGTGSGSAITLRFMQRSRVGPGVDSEQAVECTVEGNIRVLRVGSTSVVCRPECPVNRGPESQPSRTAVEGSIRVFEVGSTSLVCRPERPVSRGPESQPNRTGRGGSRPKSGTSGEGQEQTPHEPAWLRLSRCAFARTHASGIEGPLKRGPQPSGAQHCSGTSALEPGPLVAKRGGQHQGGAQPPGAQWCPGTSALERLAAKRGGQHQEDGHRCRGVYVDATPPSAPKSREVTGRQKIADFSFPWVDAYEPAKLSHARAHLPVVGASRSTWMSKVTHDTRFGRTPPSVKASGPVRLSVTGAETLE